MKTFEIRTTLALAFGNGTRPQGTVLAVIEADDSLTHHDLVAAAWDAMDRLDLGKAATCELADGVESRELLCALRSPHVELIEHVAAPDPPAANDRRQGGTNSPGQRQGGKQKSGKPAGGKKQGGTNSPGQRQGGKQDDQTKSSESGQQTQDNEPEPPGPKK